MPTISNALNTFRKLCDYNYHFKIASRKKLHDIILSFRYSDFYHLAGLQYLSDIDIPKSPTQLYNKINNQKITDEILERSINYTKVNENYANVKERIYGLQYLKEYIESKNTIFQYIKNLNRYSTIQADYLIKSTVNQQTAFIFLRKRENDDTYCICSFFINPLSDYIGIRAYWLYKSCIDKKTNTETILIDRLSTTV